MKTWRAAGHGQAQAHSGTGTQKRVFNGQPGCRTEHRDPRFRARVEKISGEPASLPAWRRCPFGAGCRPQFHFSTRRPTWTRRVSGPVHPGPSSSVVGPVYFTAHASLGAVLAPFALLPSESRAPGRLRPRRTGPAPGRSESPATRAAACRCGPRPRPPSRLRWRAPTQRPPCSCRRPRLNRRVALGREQRADVGRPALASDPSGPLFRPGSARARRRSRPHFADAGAPRAGVSRRRLHPSPF